MDLRCDTCGMVRDVPDGTSCVDEGCSGVFRATHERRGAGGTLGPPAQAVLLLAAVLMLFRVLSALVWPR